MLSTPDLCVADKDQIRLALDPLIGVEVHLVVTVDSFSQQLYGGWLAELRAGRATGWDKYVGRVLAQPPGARAPAGRAVLGRPRPGCAAEQMGMDLPRRAAARGGVSRREGALAQFLDIAGLPAGGLPSGGAGVRRPGWCRRAAQGEPTARGPLVAGLGRAADRRRPRASAMPAVPTATLRPLVERWADTLAPAGTTCAGTSRCSSTRVRRSRCRARGTSSARRSTSWRMRSPRTPGCSALVAALESRPRPAGPEAPQVEAAGQAGARQGRLAADGQRLTAYVVCVAYCEECTLSFSRSRSCSNPSKRRLPPPRMTGAVEMASTSTYPAASA